MLGRVDVNVSYLALSLFFPPLPTFTGFLICHSSPYTSYLMSYPREEEDSEMAISYATRPSTGHSQTLPSFREVRSIYAAPAAGLYH